MLFNKINIPRIYIILECIFVDCKMEQDGFENFFEQEMRESPEFQMQNNIKQDSILQAIQDRNNSEEYLKTLDELEIPQFLIEKIRKMKDTSMLLSRISQIPIDFNTIKLLFNKVSHDLDNLHSTLSNRLSLL